MEIGRAIKLRITIAKFYKSGAYYKTLAYVRFLIKNAGRFIFDFLAMKVDAKVIL